MENTSVKPRVGARPSWWTRWDITSGLFSGEGLVWGLGWGMGNEARADLMARRPFG